MPIGSHRVKGGWVKKRWDGIQDGVAMKPDWEGSGPGAKMIEDMMDATQHGNLCRSC